MIYESWPWRKGLSVGAKKIRRFARLKRYRTESFFIAEREIFLGFYAVRKLIEAKIKVSPKCAKYLLPCNRFKCLRPIGSYERSDFFEHYDLETGSDIQLPLEYVANQFIHSFIFSFNFTEEGNAEGVFFASRRDSKDFCNSISFSAIAAAFDFVAESQAKELRLVHMPEGGRDLVATQ